MIYANECQPKRKVAGEWRPTGRKILRRRKRKKVNNIFFFRRIKYCFVFFLHFFLCVIGFPGWNHLPLWNNLRTTQCAYIDLAANFGNSRRLPSTEAPFISLLELNLSRILEDQCAVASQLRGPASPLSPHRSPATAFWRIFLFALLNGNNLNSKPFHFFSLTLARKWIMPNGWTGDNGLWVIYDFAKRAQRWFIIISVSAPRPRQMIPSLKMTSVNAYRFAITRVIFHHGMRAH